MDEPFKCGCNRCVYKLNLNISTFYVIYCYGVPSDDTIETKKHCCTDDFPQNWGNKVHMQFSVYTKGSKLMNAIISLTYV